MITIYSDDIDGICSVAIIQKYFNGLGFDIGNIINVNYDPSFSSKMIKQNEPVFILNHNLDDKDWNILLSKTKNLVLINRDFSNDITNLKNLNRPTTSMLTWKFFFGFKQYPDIINIIHDIIFSKNKYPELTQLFNHGIKLEDMSPSSEFWNNVLNNVDSTFNRVINNGKILSLFEQKHC